ncbi:tetratricopeptide repeat protein [bacterium]|nr:tetratricopeptide repeat protein [bacterium]
MLKKISFIFLVFMMTSAFCVIVVYGAENSATNTSGKAYHNQKGLDHFKKGFYDLTPKKQKEEASTEYGLAIQEFNKALAVDPDYAAAHRNLARVYYVQKKFLQSAKHYKKLTELNPTDVDSYLYAASAYEKAKKYDEAIEQLEVAKSQTTSSEIIDKLDSYIEKIEQRRQKGEHRE